jgi:hypothetical protein
MKKKNIKEQQELGGVERMFKSPKLQLAIRLGCFPSDIKQGPVTDKVTNKEAVYRKATTEAYKNNPHIFFFADGTKEYRTTDDSNGKTVLTKNWFCPQIEEKVDPVQSGISPDVIKPLKEISGWKLFSEVSGSETAKYEMIDLKNVVDNPKNYEGKIRQEVLRLFLSPVYKEQFKNSFIMWKPRGGAVQKDVNLEDQFQKCLALANNLGFEDTVGGKPVTTNAQQMDLNGVSPGCSGVTETPYYVYRETPQGEVITSLMDAMKPVEGVKDVNQKEIKEKDRCKNIITLYYEAAISKEDVDQNTIDSQLKPAFNACATKLEKGDFKGIFYGKNELLKKVQALKSSGPVTTNTGMKVDYNPKNLNVRPMRENFSKNLKNIIRENLISIQQNKKKVLTEESKIVKNRFKIIGEGRTFKTKSDVRKFSDELINEMVYLNSQGFDKQVINEGFWELMSGIFPKGIDSIFDTFKERGVAWLIEKLGLNPDSWLSNVIITGLGDIDIMDVPKLFSDCTFASKAISKAIAEGTIRQFQQKKMSDSTIADVVRNTVVEMLSETELGQKLESAIGSLVCPLISGLSGKLKDAASDITDKAVGATEDSGILKSLS